MTIKSQDAVDLAALRARFEDEHERLYGVRGQPGSPVEIRAVRLAALGVAPDGALIDSSAEEPGDRPTGTSSTVYVDGDAGRGAGPRAVVDRRRARARAAARRRVRHHRRRPARLVGAPGRGDREPDPGANGMSTTAERRVDPVTLQIVANALASIADEMATTIFRTAHSTVVRDGMDFSAAILDPRGETVAQAVTVPFHLGSLPAAIERLLEHYGDRMAPGDVYLMNDPFDGGIHLQDMFLFKPVHHEGELIGFTTHDRAPRRRRRPPARLERLRQHRDLPGGDPAPLAQALRRRRAGRGRLQDHRGERPHPADDPRRPRCPGRGLLRRRAGAARARRAARPRAARGPDDRARRPHRAARPPRDRLVARRDGDLHGHPRVGRDRRRRRAHHGDRDDRRRRAHRRPDRVGADGARRRSTRHGRSSRPASTRRCAARSRSTCRTPPAPSGP